jgi:hypothetical protein
MMSKISLRPVVLGVLLCAAAAAGGPPDSHAGPNLLTNPDFEQPREGHPWMPAGWDTSGAALPSVFFGRDTFLVERGRYAVGIANVSMLYPLAYNWSQGVLVGREAWGKDAVLTVWTRSNGVQGRGFILIQAYRDTASRMAITWGVPRDEALSRLNINKIDDPFLDLGWKREYFSDLETGWVKRTVRVHVPRSVNVLFVRLGLLGTGQVLFDDASLTLEPAQRAKLPPLHTNLLEDPGFEGDGDSWEYSMPPYQNLLVVRDSAVSHSGRASVRMEGGLDGIVQARTGVGQVFPNRALAGKRVRLSGYVKTDSLRGLAYIFMGAHTLSGAKFQPTPKQFSMNTDWTLTVSEMDLPEDTYSLWVWFAYNAPAKGLVYYDDCSLEILGPASSAGRSKGRGARAPESP